MKNFLTGNFGNKYFYRLDEDDEKLNDRNKKEETKNGKNSKGRPSNAIKKSKRYVTK